MSRRARARRRSKKKQARDVAAPVVVAPPAPRTDTEVGRQGLLGRLQTLVFKLTLAQWMAIDAEYRRDDSGVDVKGVMTMVLVAVLLTIQRYFGTKRFFRNNWSHLVQDWPIPDVWSHIYWSFGCMVVYFVIPAIFVKLVYRERIRDYGLSLNGVLRHVPLYLLMFAVVLPLVFVASSSAGFLRRYPFYDGTGDSWAQLFVWEGAYGLQFVMLEFFFRGFMLFAMARYIGAYAVFAMAVPYTMIHFSKPLAETFGAVIAGTALGTLALRTRSIAGGVCIHIAVAWTMDFMAMWRKGDIQGLLGF